MHTKHNASPCVTVRQMVLTGVPASTNLVLKMQMRQCLPGSAYQAAVAIGPSLGCHTAPWQRHCTSFVGLNPAAPDAHELAAMLQGQEGQAEGAGEVPGGGAPDGQPAEEAGAEGSWYMLILLHTSPSAQLKLALLTHI